MAEEWYVEKVLSTTSSIIQAGGDVELPPAGHVVLVLW